MNIKYSTIRRIRITAPMSEKGKILDWIWKNDYYIKFSGPKSLGAGRADVTRLIVVAEKEVE